MDDVIGFLCSMAIKLVVGALILAIGFGAIMGVIFLAFTYPAATGVVVGSLISIAVGTMVMDLFKNG